MLDTSKLTPPFPEMRQSLVLSSVRSALQSTMNTEWDVQCCQIVLPVKPSSAITPPRHGATRPKYRGHTKSGTLCPSAPVRTKENWLPYTLLRYNWRNAEAVLSKEVFDTIFVCLLVYLMTLSQLHTLYSNKWDSNVNYEMRTTWKWV